MFDNFLVILQLLVTKNFCFFIARAASEFQSGLHYFILLIITNGSISDMEQTKCAIVEASKYPLSIIIVGVGDKGNFEAMHQLDSDMKMLRDIHGRKTQRDIVQVKVWVARDEEKSEKCVR